MAAHYRDDILHGKEHVDTHASSNRWRHQESTAFSNHANIAAREAGGRNEKEDLTSFLNKSRVQGKGSPSPHRPLVVDENAQSEELEAARREQEELEHKDAVNGVQRSGAGGNG